jgi:hypothetical protein
MRKQQNRIKPRLDKMKKSVKYTALEMLGMPVFSKEEEIKNLLRDNNLPMNVRQILKYIRNNSKKDAKDVAMFCCELLFKYVELEEKRVNNRFKNKLISVQIEELENRQLLGMKSAASTINIYANGERKSLQDSK